MTRFLKLLDSRMQEPEFNRNFSKAVQIDHELVMKNRAAYNRAKENYYLAQDKEIMKKTNNEK